MTEPKHAHRVLMQRRPASSLKTLDINRSISFFGNSSSLSQATKLKHSAHGARVPASRALGCGIPDNKTLLALTGRTISLASSDKGQVKQASKPFGHICLGNAVVKQTLFRLGPRKSSPKIEFLHQRNYSSLL